MENGKKDVMFYTFMYVLRGFGIFILSRLITGAFFSICIAQHFYLSSDVTYFLGVMLPFGLPFVWNLLRGGWKSLLFSGIAVVLGYGLAHYAGF